MASVSSCVREESWAGRSLWLLPPALTSNPVWFKEEGVGGSAEALDDGVLLPRSPVPPPSSCSLTDMPFIILLLLMLCFSHRALWDRAQSTHRADREGEREWERGGRVPPWFPKPCSPEPQTEGARPLDWKSEKVAISQGPPRTPDSTALSPVLRSTGPCSLPNPFFSSLSGTPAHACRGQGAELVESTKHNILLEQFLLHNKIWQDLVI